MSSPMTGDAKAPSPPAAPSAAPSEGELDLLWTRVRLAALVLTGVFVTGMLWRTLAGPSLAGLVLIGIATLGMAAASIKVVLVLAYRPWAVPLLVAGGGMLILSQIVQVSGYFHGLSEWPILGGRAFAHQAFIATCGWAGIGLLLSSFYLSLVEAAIARSRMMNERENLHREILHRQETEVQLRQARDELETRVQQRTKELVEANERLSHEVREHQRTSRSLSASEERFRQIAASAGEWIWELDSQGCYTFASQAVTDLLGYEPAEVVGMHWTHFRAPGEPEGESLPTEASSHSRRSEWKLRRDGRWVLHESTVTTAVDEEGNLTGYRGVSRDITTQKQLERQLEQTRNMEVLGQLASGVAHDFSNLISVISGCARSIRDTLGDSHSALPILSVLEEAVQQATNVTRSLTLLGHHRPIEKESVDLVSCLDQTRRLLLHLLPSHVTLDMRIPTGQIWLPADVTQLQQMLLNLAINARDAMPESGTLSIALSLVDAHQLRDPPPVLPAAARCARLEISDTGIGIPAEWQARIFEPFFTTKPRGLGTGLGLAIVDSIVKNHQGWIDLRSDCGQGTTFSIFLPCQDADSRQPAQPQPATDSFDVLVCQENRLVRGMVTSHLRALGHRVVIAPDARETLVRLEAAVDEFRVLVVDDAFADVRCEWLPRALQISSQLRVLVVRSSPDSHLNTEDARVHVLAPPFDATTFQQGVERLLTPASSEKSHEHYGASGGRPCPVAADAVLPLES